MKWEGGGEWDGGQREREKYWKGGGGVSTTPLWPRAVGRRGGGGRGTLLTPRPSRKLPSPGSALTHPHPFRTPTPHPLAAGDPTRSSKPPTAAPCGFPAQFLPPLSQPLAGSCGWRSSAAPLPGVSPSGASRSPECIESNGLDDALKLAAPHGSFYHLALANHWAGKPIGSICRLAPPGRLARRGLPGRRLANRCLARLLCVQACCGGRGGPLHLALPGRQTGTRFGKPKGFLDGGACPSGASRPPGATGARGPVGLFGLLGRQTAAWRAARACIVETCYEGASGLLFATRAQRDRGRCRACSLEAWFRGTSRLFIGTAVSLCRRLHASLLGCMNQASHSRRRDTRAGTCGPARARRNGAFFGGERLRPG
jgi:hypothetical protein